MNKHAALLAGVGAAGFATGGVLGYLLAVHKLRGRHERELQGVRQHYRNRAEAAERTAHLATFERLPTVGTVRDQPWSGDDELVGSHRTVPEARDEDLAADEPHLPDSYVDSPADALDPTLGLEDEDYEEFATRSLGFDGAELDGEDNLGPEADGSGYDPGDEDRLASAPSGRNAYVITEHQFSEEHVTDYQKLTVRYFSKDGTLADDKDAPVRNIRATIGSDGDELFRLFGVNPEQPHIVYIRNDRLQVDFEVCLDYGAYTEVVLKYGNPARNKVKPPGV